MTVPVATEEKIRHRLDPELYERQAFANLGGAIASDLEISTILRQLDSVRGDRILELGVGPGRILEKLVGRGLRVVGIDHDPRMVYFAAARTMHHPDIDLVVADGQNLPFKGGAFDAIICIRVLKYFAFPQKGVTEMSASLKSMGLLILEFPNIFGLSGMFQMYQLLTCHDFYPRLFKRSTIEEFVIENGIKIEAEHGLFKIPPKIWTLAKSRTMVELLVSLERILHKVTPMEVMSKSIILRGRKV